MNGGDQYFMLREGIFVGRTVLRKLIELDKTEIFWNYRD